MSDDILEPIRKEIYNVKREGKSVAKVHITLDFKMKIQAAMPNIAITTDPKELNADEILGYSAEVHREKTDRVWWLE